MSTVTLEELMHNTLVVLDRVAVGESVVVTRAGRPVAELRPIQSHGKRPYAVAKGEFVVPDDINDPLPFDLSRTYPSR